MTTTIKVPSRLRDRVQQHARRDQVTQAELLDRALDALDRDEFFTQLRRAVAADPETAEEQADRDEWLAGPFEDEQ